MSEKETQKRPSFRDHWQRWTPEMMQQFALREGVWALRPSRAYPAPLSMNLKD